MTESELDYYMILKFLDPSILGYSNIWAFKHDNFMLIPPHEYAITTKGKDFLTERLSKYCFFLARKEAGRLLTKVPTASVSALVILKSSML